MIESIKTKAIVLRRTNYGEADRILNVLTPEGKMSVMAKGVRKTRSKLAGGIELFCVSDVVVHRGRGELGILTSARLVEFYGEIVKDLGAMELAGEVLRQASRRAEQVDGPEYFDLVEQVLAGMNEALKDDGSDKLPLVRAWWGMNVARVSGEEVNLRMDVDGAKLRPEERYVWDAVEQAMRKSENGEMGAEHIKLMRLMVSSPLKLALKVKSVEKLVDEIGSVLRSLV